MRSALEIVAFTQGNKPEGIIALLEVALQALDEEGMSSIAIHVDLALATLRVQHEAKKGYDRAGKVVHPSNEFVH